MLKIIHILNENSRCLQNSTKTKILIQKTAKNVINGKKIQKTMKFWIHFTNEFSINYRHFEHFLKYVPLFLHTSINAFQFGSSESKASFPKTINNDLKQ